MGLVPLYASFSIRYYLDERFICISRVAPLQKGGFFCSGETCKKEKRAIQYWTIGKYNWGEVSYRKILL